MTVTTGSRERWEYQLRQRKKFLCVCDDCLPHGYWTRRIRLAAEFASKSFMVPRWKRRSMSWKGGD